MERMTLSVARSMWAAIFSMFSVDDSKEVKNCIRRELEIFMPIKPNAMTRMTEVERNSLSVMPNECLRSQRLATTWAVHKVPHSTLCTTFMTSRSLRCIRMASLRETS